MLGFRFAIDCLWPNCKTQTQCWVYSRVKPPHNNREVIEFPDEVTALFYNNHRMHTVIVDMATGIIVDTNERVC
jgi:hypothetical protein